MRRLWKCEKCGFLTPYRADMRRHFRNIVPCDVAEIFCVNEEIMDALDEDKRNFNIFALPIYKE